MNLKKLFPLFVTLACTADCFALEDDAVARILIRSTLFDTAVILAVLVYFAINALVIKWFGLFGLCLVIAFNTYLPLALLFLNSR